MYINGIPVEEQEQIEYEAWEQNNQESINGYDD